MKPLTKKSLLTLSVMAGIAMGASGTASAAGITEAITGGKAKADFRLRMETVEQDNAREDASSLTLRSRLGYGTAEYKGFSGYMEFEHVTALDDDYSIPGGADQTYSIVADPEGAELNQMYLKYSFGETSVMAGRQRLILDNARFVGNVGWRQNEQTFDALTISSKALEDTVLTYGYIDQVNEIFATENDVAAHLFNASYSGLPGKITGYAYLIEQKEKTASSTSTMGLRYAGAVGDAVKFNLEYATQSDYKDGNSDIDADYYLVEVIGKVSTFNLKLGYEVLGGDDFSGFETPLATKHAFNGWADAFLLDTPEDGLADFYLSASTKVAGAKLMAVYHDYSAETGSDDYGSEINLLAVKKYGKNYTALLKYASYSAGDDRGTDTDKLWLMGQMKF